MGLLGKLFGKGDKCAKCAGTFRDNNTCGTLTVNTGNGQMIIYSMTCQGCGKTTCPACIGKASRCPLCGSLKMEGKDYEVVLR